MAGHKIADAVAGLADKVGLLHKRADAVFGDSTPMRWLPTTTDDAIRQSMESYERDAITWQNIADKTLRKMAADGYYPFHIEEERVKYAKKVKEYQEWAKQARKELEKRAKTLTKR